MEEKYEIMAEGAIQTKTGWRPAEDKSATHYVISAADYMSLAVEMRRLQEAERSRTDASDTDWMEKYLHEESLNRNLRRIAKERANKARGIDKHSSGYLIKSWSEFSHRRQIKSGHHYIYEEIPLCRIVIQTPIDCSIPLDDAEYQIRKDIESGLLNLGDDIVTIDRAVSLDTAIDESQQRNTVLQMQWRSDIKAGLWGVTLITNFEPVIDERYREGYV